MPESFKFGRDAVRQITKVVRRVLQSEFFDAKQQATQAAGGGTLRLAKIQNPCAKNTSCAIVLHSRGGRSSDFVSIPPKGSETPIVGQSDFEAYNRFADIPIENPWVIVAQVDGGFEIIAANPCAEGE